MYRTGDLGRWLEDGAIEFLGRNDHQVKIRGFRIELGEIESQLTSIDNVKQAVVVAKDSSAGDKRLVAYIVPAGVTSDAARAEELRTRLRAALPVYMVPDAFVFLDVLPLTPNGKVDLHALPVPDLRSSASAELEAPQGDVETSIAGIWTDLLQLGSVGRKENFFALGGNSLHGMRLIAGVEEALAVSLPVTAVFQCPTIEELGSLVRSMLVRREPALESVEFDFEEGVIQCSDPESR